MPRQSIIVFVLVVFLTGALVVGSLLLEPKVALLANGAIISLLLLHLRRARITAEASVRRAVQSERRFSESFHASPIPLVVTNLATGHITDVNNELVRMIGWSHEQLVGHSLVALEVVRGTEQAALVRRLRRAGVVRNHGMVLRCNGKLRDVVLSLDLMMIDNEPYSLTTIVDHTDRKRTEVALEHSDERFRQLAEAVGDAFWMTDLERERVLYVSPAYDTIWGRSGTRLYEHPQDWLAAIHPDDRETVVDLQRATPLPCGSIEEFRIVRPDGVVRWIRNTSYTARDADGRPVRLVGVATDITSRRELEDQLRESQKMDSIGVLAGGVAHDFNNVLAVISASNGLLAESIPLSSPDRELVDEVSAAVSSATALTRQLLSFSRRKATEPAVVDLNATVIETTKMLRRIIGPTIQLATSLDPDLPPIHIDPSSLVQMVMNLSVNARDAMRGNGTLRITTSFTDDKVMLSIGDTGSGMSAEVRARIFEPFFTTKEVGRGTGLGLSVVCGIVERAGGRIEVESVIDQGTTFRISLPALATKRGHPDPVQCAAG